MSSYSLVYFLLSFVSKLNTLLCSPLAFTFTKFRYLVIASGNSEIILDRKLTDKRLFPTIDITRSGTRKEELLVDKTTLSKMWVLRRVLMPMGPADAMEFLMEKLKQSKNNHDFFDAMNS